jgi:DNA-binding NtrC family response regulator
MPTILIIDDERSVRSSLAETLSLEGYEVEQASDGLAGWELISQGQFDLVFSDIKMPRMDGMELLTRVQEVQPELPVIMISGHGTEELAMEATRLGAFDFVHKPPDLNRLLITVRNALERKQLVVETRSLKEKQARNQEIIGESEAIRRIKTTIERVAPTDARILITGENGTGKELVARWIHEKSARRRAPLVEVNCAAIPSDLIESELFGHEKGAFTSAIKQRIGKFEQAHGGTLFLDEIGDMPLEAQAKMLRALQECRITRVGGEKDISIDVRVVAATNKDLLSEIDARKFRLDLYHRLSVILVHVPSLGERRDDIPSLTLRFAEEVCASYGMAPKKFTPDALQTLSALRWTGNIRELHNVVERLVILGGGTIRREDVLVHAHPSQLETGTPLVSEPEIHPLDPSRFDDFQAFKEEAEKVFILQKLQQFDWNMSRTAEHIGIQRGHLYNKLEKYGLRRGQDTEEFDS